MDLFEALYTTRTMRRMHDTPVPDEAKARILDAAIRAPSGRNHQQWKFVMVDSPEIVGLLAPHYRRSLAQFFESAYAVRIEKMRAAPELESSKSLRRLLGSGQHLADNFERVPLILFPSPGATTTRMAARCGRACGARCWPLVGWGSVRH